MSGLFRREKRRSDRVPRGGGRGRRADGSKVLDMYLETAFARAALGLWNESLRLLARSSQFLCLIAVSSTLTGRRRA